MPLFRRKKKQSSKITLREKDLKAPTKMFIQYPDGIREALLNDLAYQLINHNTKLSTSYGAAADKISQKHMTRNLQGEAYEKRAKNDPSAIKLAIELYQQNVAEMFAGEYPYQRLRIIYTKLKQYDHAIAACQAYLNMVNAHQKVVGDVHGVGTLQKNIQTYMEWIRKLEIQKRKSQSG